MSEFSDWFESRGPSMTYWKGVQVVKHPSDLFAIAKIIWDTKPDIVVETGTWHGGSALFYADLGVEVHSIDVAPSKTPPEHPNITYHRGYSTAATIHYFVSEACRGKRTMVLLDSDHHKKTVLDELGLYAGLVTPGCYLVVEDTLLGVEVWNEPDNSFVDNGPAAALSDWLPDHPEFVLDFNAEPVGISQNPGGFLLRSHG